MHEFSKMGPAGTGEPLAERVSFFWCGTRFRATSDRLALERTLILCGRGRPIMKILAVHPSSLMYSKIFLRLEPLGIELIAAAARRAGHDVRLIDLQVEPAAELSTASSTTGGPTRSRSRAIIWRTCPR